METETRDQTRYYPRIWACIMILTRAKISAVNLAAIERVLGIEQEATDGH